MQVEARACRRGGRRPSHDAANESRWGPAERALISVWSGCPRHPSGERDHHGRYLEYILSAFSR
jgi:hypothetical protein